MDIKNEDELKAIIRGLVLSAPKGMTLREISRDFLEMIGTNIPYRYYGFPNLISFLKSLSDTVKVIESGSMTLIIPIVTQETLHLEEMVHKQKKAPLKGRLSRRVLPRPRGIVRHNQRKKLTKHIDGTCESSYETVAEDDDYEYNSRLKRNADAQPSVQHFDGKFHTNRSEFNDFRRDSLENIASESSKKNCVKLYNESFNAIESSSSDKSRCTILRQRLVELISSQPNGLWCSDLPYIYFQNFNTELNIQAMGYTNVAHFCSTYTDVFKCVRLSDSDWKVFDARYPLPTPLLETDNFMDFDKITSSKPNALPDDVNIVGNESYDYPENVMKFGDKIPVQTLLGPLDDYFVIRITEIYDPSKFWFQLYSEECSAALDEQMGDMQIYYSEADENFQIPQHLMLVGMYCVAKYEFEWTRAMIVKTEELFISVYFFDYGSVQMYNKSEAEFYFLHMDFATLPRQGIRGRLSGIRPNSTDNLWSRQATRFFLQFVADKNLMALINQNQKLDECNHTIDLVLTDTSSDEDIHVNDLMVSEKFATQETIQVKINEICSLTTDNHVLCYLFPLHRDIEWARVLSVNEIDSLAQNGIRMEHIYKLNMQELQKNRMKPCDSTSSLYLVQKEVKMVDMCTDVTDLEMLSSKKRAEGFEKLSIANEIDSRKNSEKTFNISNQQTTFVDSIEPNYASNEINNQNNFQNVFPTRPVLDTCANVKDFEMLSSRYQSEAYEKLSNDDEKASRKNLEFPSNVFNPETKFVDATEKNYFSNEGNNQNNLQNLFPTRPGLRPPPGFPPKPMHNLNATMTHTNIFAQNSEIPRESVPTLNPIYNPMNCSFNFNINLNSNFKSQPLCTTEPQNAQFSPNVQFEKRETNDLVPFNNMMPQTNMNENSALTPFKPSNVPLPQNMSEPQFAMNKSIELMIAHLLKSSFSSNDENDSMAMACNAQKKIDELKVQTSKLIQERPKLIEKPKIEDKPQRVPSEWAVFEKDFIGKRIRLFKYQNMYLMSTLELLLKFTHYQAVAQVKCLFSANPRNYTSKVYKLNKDIFNSKDPFLGYDENNGSLELILLIDIPLFLENIFCFDMKFFNEIDKFLRDV